MTYLKGNIVVLRIAEKVGIIRLLSGYPPNMADTILPFMASAISVLSNAEIGCLYTAFVSGDTHGIVKKTCGSLC